MEPLSWQTAFAIVGSVVAIIIGIFGYLLKTRGPSVFAEAAKPTHVTLDQLHSRISDIKDRIAKIESNVNVTKQKASSIQGQVDAHEHRDEKEFEKISIKLDKLTDILMKILSDDKL